MFYKTVSLEVSASHQQNLVSLSSKFLSQSEDTFSCLRPEEWVHLVPSLLLYQCILQQDVSRWGKGKIKCAFLHACICAHTGIFNIFSVVLGPTHLTRKDIISLSTFYFHYILSQFSSPHAKAKIRRRKRRYHKFPAIFVLQVFLSFLPFSL